MSIESPADRAAFMSVFGVSVSVSGITGLAIFDDPHSEALEVNSSSPMLTIVDADFPSIAYGQAVVVSSASFSGTVRDVQPDGTGCSIILLGKTT